MEYKDYILEELKDEFFPYEEDEFEEKIRDNFTEYGLNDTDGSFFIDSMYGKKFTVVYYKTAIFIFIQNKKELVILVMTSFTGFVYRKSLKNFETQSITNIDIIASKEWVSENKEIIDIVSVISKNKVHIGVEYLIKGDGKIVDFNQDYLNSPLLWFLLRDNSVYTRNRRKIGSSVKTKSNFLPGLIRVIQNSLFMKNDGIEKKDFSPLRENLFSYFTQKLLRPNPRKYLMEDLISRNGVIFSSTIYSNMFASLKYDRDKWNNYIQAEIIEYLKIDYLNYLENILISTDIDKDIISAVFFNMRQHKVISKKMKRKYNYITLEIIESFLFANNQKYYIELIDELKLFVQNNFEQNILNGQYIQRIGNVEDIPFAEDLFKQMGDELVDLVEDENSEIHNLNKIQEDSFNDGQIGVIHNTNSVRPYVSPSVDDIPF